MGHRRMLMNTDSMGGESCPVVLKKQKQESRELDDVVEERSAPDGLAVDGKKLRGVIPYETESRDLGGWKEVMRKGCLRNAELSDLVATVDHAGLPIGRYPSTLTIEDREDGLHWSVELPESRDPLSSFEAGYKLTEDLITQKRPFTAVLAFDDMSAFGAIRALAKAELRVPENCSVIGFDDVASSALYTPSLTTVRQPMESMGASAVGIVVDGINAVLEKREIGATHRKVAPELVVRESTRSPL